MYAPDLASVATPIGRVVIAGGDAVIDRVRLAPAGPAVSGRAAAVVEAAAQVGAYFSGRPRVFALPLARPVALRGDVPRRAIMAVRFGGSTSYAMLATPTGSSARALGQACARDPCPFVVPCHRCDGTAS